MIEPAWLLTLAPHYVTFKSARVPAICGPDTESRVGGHISQGFSGEIYRWDQGVQ